MAYGSFEDIEVWERECRFADTIKIVHHDEVAEIVVELKELSSMLQGFINHLKT